LPITPSCTRTGTPNALTFSLIRTYTEELVKRLKATQVEGNGQFLSKLDPAFVARDLVDDRFVRKSIAAAGGMSAFGLPDGFNRTETIAV
jgi:NitT/TauT family transport system substrate-binding protein